MRDYMAESKNRVSMAGSGTYPYIAKNRTANVKKNRCTKTDEITFTTPYAETDFKVKSPVLYCSGLSGCFHRENCFLGTMGVDGLFLGRYSFVLLAWDFCVSEAAYALCRCVIGER